MDQLRLIGVTVIKKSHYPFQNSEFKMGSGTLPVVFQHRAIVQYSEVLQTL